MYLKYLLAFIISVCLFLIFLWLSITLPVYSIEIYKNEYKSRNVSENIKVSNEDLIKVTTRVLDYLQDKENDLNIKISVNNNVREFFNEQEKSHMAEVKDIFYSFNKIFIGCIFIFIACLILFLIILKRLNKKNKLLEIYSMFKKIYILFNCLFLFFILISILISTDFEKYFIIFHKIFFKNPTWLFDLNTDFIVNLFSLSFFINIDIIIFCIFISFYFLFTIAFFIFKNKINKLNINSK